MKSRRDPRRIIILGAAPVLFRFLWLPSPAMSPLDGIIQIGRDLTTFANGLDNTTTALAEGKMAQQTLVGADMHSKLNDIDTRIKNITAPEPVNLNTAVSSNGLFSNDFAVREAEITKARAYVQSKEDELKMAKTTVEQLDALNVRA